MGHREPEYTPVSQLEAQGVTWLNPPEEHFLLLLGPNTAELEQGVKEVALRHGRHVRPSDQ
jgi:hypothetical protein